MSFVVLVMLLVCIGLPLFYCWRLWQLHESTFAGWLVGIMEATLLIMLVLTVGRWDMAGYYVRYLLVAVFAASAIRAARRHRFDEQKLPHEISGRPQFWRTHRSTVVSLLLYALTLGYVLEGRVSPQPSHELAFPLQGGRFIVGQGGGNFLLNHHAGHAAQQYAADIVALNGAGFRANGLLPKAVDHYAVYGAQVVSPCTGEVINLQDGLPDLAPPDADSDNAAGNHVVIDCKGLHVELAHLQTGSIVVSAADMLQAGDAIGRVGNSGNTTEPHLHIHAIDASTGAGVPLVFDGVVPLRNQVYQR